MKLRRALALSLFAALLVPSARAQDAQLAGASATAAAPGAQAAPAAPAPKTAAPKKKKSKRKAAAGKKKPAPESKYKSTALSEGDDSHYRFDENANPIDGGAKKKSSSKAKKKSAEDSADKPACTEDAPCSDKKSSDADAL